VKVTTAAVCDETDWQRRRMKHGSSLLACHPVPPPWEGEAPAEPLCLFFFTTEGHGRTRKNGTVVGVASRVETHDWGIGNQEPSARQEPRPPEGGWSEGVGCSARREPRPPEWVGGRFCRRCSTGIKRMCCQKLGRSQDGTSTGSRKMADISTDKTIRCDL